MAKRKKQNEDESQENINNESDDTFGLPEIEYEPLKRDEPQYSEPVAEVTPEPEEVAPEIEEGYQDEVVAEEEQEYRSPYMEDDKPAMWPKVLGIGLVVLIGAAAAWYFLSYKPAQDAAKEKARLEQVAREENAKKLRDAQAAEQKRQDDERRRADSLANAQPAVGEIEALSGRTGRYYIVVASAIDDDLIMDHAKVLSSKGVSCKIIPPFGKTKFSRLSIDSKDTYADAQSTADGMKGGDYGNDIWVVKY